MAMLPLVVKLVAISVKVASVVKLTILLVQMISIQTTMKEAVIIQLFRELLVLTIQFILKFHRHHSIVEINHCPDTMPMLKLNVKYSIFAL